MVQLIETDRLILRKYTSDDAAFFLRLANDPDVRKGGERYFQPSTDHRMIIDNQNSLFRNARGSISVSFHFDSRDCEFRA